MSEYFEQKNRELCNILKKEKKKRKKVIVLYVLLSLIPIIVGATLSISIPLAIPMELSAVLSALVSVSGGINTGFGLLSIKNKSKRNYKHLNELKNKLELIIDKSINLSEEEMKEVLEKLKQL